MATIFKCKMCGGDIEVSQDMTVGTCLFCGSTMTLPRIDSDKKARLFNRANEYRLNNEFDKAYEAYKTITEEDEQEAEAYWGMILSEYGVEYVEDPGTGKRVPTCHRTQAQSIRSSTNFQLAIQYADSERKFIYQDEAEVIDKLQRSILSVSSKEEPYDVFICYKETDNESGQRTPDSVLAQEIYQELEKNGIRAFFSRISLETHLGENYEPYIYSALKSARVMLMVSTSAENCDAVWVKNEWSRFLHFMSEDSSKVIIPVYREMTPYDFPEELSGFQAQDMGKVGAVQDLVYGIKKLLGTTKTATQDATLQALVEDKLKRENIELSRKKKNKIILTIAIVAIVCAIMIFLGVILRKRIYKSYWTNKIENNVISVNNGIPSSDEYTKLDLVIDKDNFDEYFQFEKAGGKWYLSSRLIEEGWIYAETEGFTYSQALKNKKDSLLKEKTCILILKSTRDSSKETDLFPLYVDGSSIAEITIQESYTDFEPFHVIFISNKAVKDYRFEDAEYGGCKRIVEFKNGVVLNNSAIKNIKY